MDVMAGFPPETSARATIENWRTAPFTHWAFHHVREIVPNAAVENAPDDVWRLDAGALDLSTAQLDVAVTEMANDALVILHRGKVVHESYRNGMRASDPHILMSVSKSMLGLVAGTCVARGELSLDAHLVEFLPELANTAYAGATVRHALDMRVGVRFEEDYTAMSGPIIEYRKAANWNPLQPGETAEDLRSFQKLMTEPDGPHGGRFHYVSPVTDLLAWLLERATGTRYADLVSERLLKPLGAERAGYITVDRIGGARAAGGLCLTARDLARVGQMMLQDGARGSQQVIPAAWVQDIWSGGDKQAWSDGDFEEKFPGIDMSYRSKWYVHHGPDPMIHGLGIHGQFLFADPKRELVMAWLSSEHMPTDPGWAAHVFATWARIRTCVD